MISLLIFALVVLLVVAVCIYILRLLPLPSPWGNVGAAILCLIGLLIVLEHSGVLHG